MPSLRRSRARHKRSDERAVISAFENGPRSQQERLLTDMRRRAIVGDGADPVHASCPLDVMYARKVSGAGGVKFGDDHLHAAIWFIRLYRYRLGRCTPKGTLDIGVNAGDTNPEQEHRDAEFRALMADRRMAEARMTLVCPLVFDVFPKWLQDIIGANGELRIGKEQIAFMAAIDTLRTIWLEFAGLPTETLRDRAATAGTVLQAIGEGCDLLKIAHGIDS